MHVCMYVCGCVYVYEYVFASVHVCIYTYKNFENFCIVTKIP